MLKIYDLGTFRFFVKLKLYDHCCGKHTIETQQSSETIETIQQSDRIVSKSNDDILWLIVYFSQRIVYFSQNDRIVLVLGSYTFSYDRELLFDPNLMSFLTVSVFETMIKEQFNTCLGRVLG